MSSSVSNSSSTNIDDSRFDEEEEEEDEEAREARRKEDHVGCVELVQTRDYEGYLCGLLLPKSAREHYFALRAFNIEIASIKDGGSVKKRRTKTPGQGVSGSSSLASQLRMQWWRDAVAFLYQRQCDTRKRKRQPQPPNSNFTSNNNDESFLKNPIVRSLHHTILTKRLTPRFLNRLIDARETDLEIYQYPTIHSLLRYSEQTYCSLLYLTLECCDILDEEADAVAFQIGVGVGITTAIRGIVVRASPGGSGEMGIPKEVMDKWGVSVRYLQDPPASAAWGGGRSANRDTEEVEDRGDQMAREAMQGAVEEMAHVAWYHLRKGRGMQGKVPRGTGGTACLLPAVLAMEYLDRLESVGFNVFHADLVNEDSLDARLGRLRRSFLLMRAWLTSVF